jgi:hypothetical protein
MYNQFTSRWQKWNGLNRQQRRLFWRALLYLKLAGLLLHFFRYQDLYARLKALAPLERPAVVEPSLLKAAETAAVVEMAARRRLANATCLRQSLVLWYLLRRQGIDSELRLGVRKRGGEVQGHAWVEIDGSVINDDLQIIQQYTPMDLEKRPPRSREAGMEGDA